LGVHFEPLTVNTATVHDSRVSRFHSVGDPTFFFNTQFIHNTLIFCFVQAPMKLPAMLRLLKFDVLPHMFFLNLVDSY
jgi:hypothetical protein